MPGLLPLLTHPPSLRWKEAGAAMPPLRQIGRRNPGGFRIKRIEKNLPGKAERFNSLAQEPLQYLRRGRGRPTEFLQLDQFHD